MLFNAPSIFIMFADLLAGAPVGPRTDQQYAQPKHKRGNGSDRHRYRRGRQTCGSAALMVSGRIATAPMAVK